VDTAPSCGPATGIKKKCAPVGGVFCPRQCGGDADILTAMLRGEARATVRVSEGKVTEKKMRLTVTGDTASLLAATPAW